MASGWVTDHWSRRRAIYCQVIIAIIITITIITITVLYNMMFNRWRTKNEVIFHESELLREKQFEIGNFMSGEDFVIQVNYV